MNIETLSDKLRALAALKVDKKELAAQTKDVSMRIDEQEREIMGDMLDMAEAAGLQSADDFSVLVDGRRYSVVTRPFYSIRAEDRDAAFAALRDVGLGDLVVERVDERILSRTMIEIIDGASGELPEQYAAIPMQRYDKQTISDRKVSR